MALAAEIRRAQPGFEAWATIGLHPHEASQGWPKSRPSGGSRSPTAGDVVVAVGECGLDYHYDHSPRAAQRDAFAAQIALAQRHSLTLVVHTRSAWDDTIDILRAEGVPARTIMHCFTGGVDEARALSRSRGVPLVQRHRDIQERRRRARRGALCPLDRLLVETDAPFLAPYAPPGCSQPAGVGRRGR